MYRVEKMDYINFNWRDRLIGSINKQRSVLQGIDGRIENTRAIYAIAILVYDPVTMVQNGVS